MATIDLGKGINADGLKDDQPIAGLVDGAPVILVRHGGKICALAGECTHLGAPLEKGLVVDGEIRCPWHHARFSLRSGEAVGAPAFAALARFSVVEEDGRILVTGKADATPSRPRAARDPGRVVIVGGGGAGHACAEMLARSGVTATVLSDDPDAPYDRTFCSKQYLAGDKERPDTALPGVAGMRTDTAVASIDREARSITLKSGERIDYDVLVLATGAEPTVATFDGADRPDVFRLRTLADADLLIAAAQDATRAVVLGTSYIGLEAAASLSQRGLAVTVVGESELPLVGTAGPEVGAFIQSVHQEHDVDFRMERNIVAFDGKVATLDDGSTVKGSFVVMGIGVAPRIELAKAAGLTLADEKAGGGVVVDAQLQTSTPGIYAIGDIANVPDPRLGHPIRVEHWVVAQRQGQWLARHLTGEIEGYYGDTPFFWSGHYDTSLRYVGHVAKPDDRTVEGSVADGDFAVRMKEDGEQQAVLTCGRDKLALDCEAAWDRS